MARGKTIGARLREARELGGISARHLDGLAGITPGHSAAIESGRRPRIEAGTAASLARALGISLDWLISGQGASPSEEGVAASLAEAGRKKLAKAS